MCLPPTQRDLWKHRHSPRIFMLDSRISCRGRMIPLKNHLANRKTSTGPGATLIASVCSPMSPLHLLRTKVTTRPTLVYVHEPFTIHGSINFATSRYTMVPVLAFFVHPHPFPFLSQNTSEASIIRLVELFKQFLRRIEHVEAVRSLVDNIEILLIVIRKANVP